MPRGARASKGRVTRFPLRLDAFALARARFPAGPSRRVSGKSRFPAAKKFKLAPAAASVISPEVEAEAKALGYGAKLKLLLTNPKVAARGLAASDLLEAIKAAGGSVVTARKVALGPSCSGSEMQGDDIPESRLPAAKKCKLAPADAPDISIKVEAEAKALGYGMKLKALLTNPKVAARGLAASDLLEQIKAAGGSVVTARKVALGPSCSGSEMQGDDIPESRLPAAKKCKLAPAAAPDISIKVRGLAASDLLKAIKAAGGSVVTARKVALGSSCSGSEMEGDDIPESRLPAAKKCKLAPAAAPVISPDVEAEVKALGYGMKLKALLTNPKVAARGLAASALLEAIKEAGGSVVQARTSILRPSCN